MNEFGKRTGESEREMGRGKGNKGERSIAHTVPRLKGFFFTPMSFPVFNLFFYFIMILLYGLETFNVSTKIFNKISNIIKLCWTELNKVSSWIVLQETDWQGSI